MITATTETVVRLPSADDWLDYGQIIDGMYAPIVTCGRVWLHSSAGDVESRRGGPTEDVTPFGGTDWWRQRDRSADTVGCSNR